MLIPCSREAWERIRDYAYALATDPTASGYPTYCDGIKTKAMFFARTEKAFTRGEEALLLYLEGDEVRGLLHLYWLPEDRYLSTVSFNVETDPATALEELLAYAGARFPGYDLYLGFPAENRAAIAALTARGFACIENDWNNTAFLDTLTPPPPAPDIVRIDRDNYPLFATLHRQTEGEMYWNTERIQADLDNWVILVKTGAEGPLGAVYFMDAEDGWFEIFGIDLPAGPRRPALFQELLQAALWEARARGGRVMTFFCEEEEEPLARACGLACVGNYQCYKTTLNSLLFSPQGK